jgi:hypothetical protein
MDGAEGGTMLGGRTPLYLTLLAAGLLAAAMLTMEPYSVSTTWDAAYTKPARRYLRAALEQDSTALVRHSAGGTPVAWALRAGRAHPDSLAVRARYARAWTGAKVGDTADVFLSTATDVCDDHPIMLRFVGTGDSAKVLRVSSACFEPDS